MNKKKTKTKIQYNTEKISKVKQFQNKKSNEYLKTNSEGQKN